MVRISQHSSSAEFLLSTNTLRRCMAFVQPWRISPKFAAALCHTFPLRHTFPFEQWRRNNFNVWEQFSAKFWKLPFFCLTVLRFSWTCAKAVHWNVYKYNFDVCSRKSKSTASLYYNQLAEFALTIDEILWWVTYVTHFTTGPISVTFSFSVNSL
jgi:hypothetical protein